MNILVADDDITSRKLLGNVLHSYGSCRVLDNGSDAVQVFIEAHKSGVAFELVCLDLEMPYFNGRKCLEMMRDWEGRHGGRASKIIMLSATRNTDSNNDLGELGCDALIRKPVIRAEIHSVLKGFGMAPEKVP